MPTYKVTDPNTGKTLKLTGDSPPKADELERIFSQYSAEATKPVERTNELDAIGSMIPAPVSELAGAINRGAAQGADFFVDAANYVLPEGAQIPRPSNVLEEATGGTRNFMEPGLARDVIQTGGEWVPAYAGMASSAAREGAKAIGQVKQTWGEPVDVARGKRIQVASEQAAKNGVDEGVVTAINQSSRESKQSMNLMLQKMKHILKDRRLGMDVRPADVAGKVMEDRVKVIAKQNRLAGSRVGEEAKKLTGSVDSTPAFFRLEDSLSEAGVKLSDNLVADFRGADFEDIAASERLINNLLKRLQKIDPGDPQELHRLKKYIDENVFSGKAAEGLTGRAESIVKEFRHDINQVLREHSSSYAKANDEFAETKQVLDAINDALPSKMNLDSPRAGSALGQESRKLMSNYASRQSLANALDSLDAVSAKYGADTAVDIKDLVLFADELDRVFSPAARTSFKGDIAGAAKAVTQGEGKSYALGKMFDKVFGPKQEKALEALEELVK